MKYVGKGLFLLFGTAMMVLLLLAAGGVHILPENEAFNMARMRAMQNQR